MGEVIANSPTPGVAAQLTTLGGSLTNVATSLTASAAVTGNLLNGNFRALIGDGVQNSGAYEIVLVTAGQSGTTWTIKRGMEASAAAAWNNATPIYHAWTQAGVALALPASRQDLAVAGLGILSQAWDLGSGYGNSLSGTATTQQIYASLLGLTAGDVVTNILALVGTAGVGTTPTNIFVGLVGPMSSLSGSRVAVSNDLKANAIWTAGQGVVQAPLSAPLTVAATGAYYACFLANGTWGTTQLGLRNAPTVSVIGTSGIGSNAQKYVKLTGQTTIPTSPTFVNDTTGMWLGCN